MKLDRAALVALCLMLPLSACSDADAAPEGGTTDLTRSLLEQPSSDGVSTSIPTGSAVTDDGGPRIRVSDVGINRGSIDAPVKVVEMSDYGCSYCRQFHEETFPSILAEFIETGMVEWKFVPYITGMWETSFPATSAAECAYQQDAVAFERLNHRLWSDQREWKGAGDAAPGIVRAWVSELIVAGPEWVEVTRQRHKRKRQSQLEAAWAVVELVPPEVAWYGPKVILRSRGRSIELGQFLTIDEKKQLADQVRRAIRKHSAIKGAFNV